MDDLKLCNSNIITGANDWFPVQIDGRDVLVMESTADDTLSLLAQVQCTRSVRILDRLRSEGTVSLELYCRARHTILQPRRKQCKSQASYELLVNVFGTPYMFERIGRFFELVGIYLQDPVCGNRDVPYGNPHVLAEDDGTATTGSLYSMQQLENFMAPSDIFDQLLTSDRLPEVEVPQAIRTVLHRYEVMLYRVG